MFWRNEQKVKKSLEIAEFIDNYKEFLLKEKIFESIDDIEYFFTMGGCFIFARILMSEFPEAKLLINNRKSHCKVRYYDKNYDIDGFKYKRIDTNFKLAKKEDVEYMKENFGFKSYCTKGQPQTREDFDNSFIAETIDFYHGGNLKTIGTITISNKRVS